LFPAYTNPVTAPNSAKQKKVKPIEVSSDQFLWRVDLHSMGYPDNGNQLQSRRGLDEFDTVDFVGEGVVAATFITQEPAPGLQRRDDPNRAPLYRLHAVFLEAASGKVLKTLDWPLDNPNAGIFPRYDGSFLFLSTHRIVLYSPDWTPVKELPLPQLQQPHAYLAGIAESPSGKVLVVRFHQGSSIRCVRISTDTLEGSEEPCEIPEEFTVSDDAMAVSEWGRDRTEDNEFGPEVYYHGFPMPSHGPDPRRILIREMGKPVRTLCDCLVCFPQFISNQTIVTYSSPYLWLFDVAGHLEFKKEFDRRGPEELAWIDDMGRPVRPSTDGRRFALALNTPIIKGATGYLVKAFKTEPGDPPATFPDRIDIFDAPNGQLIYTLKDKVTQFSVFYAYDENNVLIKGQYPIERQFPQIMGLALSPSGEKLAIDSGGVIQVYALPPAAQTPPPSH